MRHSPDFVAMVEMIRRGGRVEALLVAHAPDASGRCPQCRAGGDGSGHVASPCTLLSAALVVAEEARPTT